jgi:hypothetical protein
VIVPSCLIGYDGLWTISVLHKPVGLVHFPQPT